MGKPSDDQRRYGLELRAGSVDLAGASGTAAAGDV
jgi:hypothetical protein